MIVNLTMPTIWSSTTSQEVLAQVSSIFSGFSGLVVFAVSIGLALLFVGFIVDRFF